MYRPYTSISLHDSRGCSWHNANGRSYISGSAGITQDQGRSCWNILTCYVICYGRYCIAHAGADRVGRGTNCRRKGPILDGTGRSMTIELCNVLQDIHRSRFAEESGGSDSRLDNIGLINRLRWRRLTIGHPVPRMDLLSSPIFVRGREVKIYAKWLG